MRLLQGFPAGNGLQKWEMKPAAGVFSSSLRFLSPAPGIRIYNHPIAPLVISIYLLLLSSLQFFTLAGIAFDITTGDVNYEKTC